MVPAPDGNGLLISSLGFVDGTGQIDRYGFDGQFLETFATNSHADPNLGFSEPTGLLAIGSDVPPTVPGDYKTTAW